MIWIEYFCFRELIRIIQYWMRREQGRCEELQACVQKVTEVQTKSQSTMQAELRCGLSIALIPGAISHQAEIYAEVIDA